MIYYTGIDIGSTASKVVVLSDTELVTALSFPPAGPARRPPPASRTGWPRRAGPVDRDMVTVATGYGRVSVELRRQDRH